MKKCTLLILFVLMNCILISAQSKFAPIIGAEWHYSFISDTYDYNYSFFEHKKGILEVRYTKDTVVGNFTLKKFEQKETFKNKGNDTLFSEIKNPVFMLQRNDTVFLLLKDTLEPAFFYKTQLTAKTKIEHFINQELKSVTDTTALNNRNILFKAFNYAQSCTCFDAYFEYNLIILDRIGALNADITVIETQGKAVNGANYYRLVCYNDNEIGEVKFLNQDCNTLTAVADLNSFSIDFDLFNQPDLFNIHLPDHSPDFFQKIKIYDVSGRLVWKYDGKNDLKNISILKSNLPQGVLIVTVQGKNIMYKAKKIFNNN